MRDVLRKSRGLRSRRSESCRARQPISQLTNDLPSVSVSSLHARPTLESGSCVTLCNERPTPCRCVASLSRARSPQTRTCCRLMPQLATPFVSVDHCSIDSKFPATSWSHAAPVQVDLGAGRRGSQSLRNLGLRRCRPRPLAGCRGLTCPRGGAYAQNEDERQGQAFRTVGHSRQSPRHPTVARRRGGCPYPRPGYNRAGYSRRAVAQVARKSAFSRPLGHHPRAKLGPSRLGQRCRILERICDGGRCTSRTGLEPRSGRSGNIQTALLQTDPNQT